MMYRELSRFITRLLLFTGFAAVVYWLCIIAAGLWLPQHLRENLTSLKGAYGHMHTRVREAQTTRNTDILVLGSSHAYRGFDPRIFAQHGFKTFNLGSSSQTPVQTRALLNRYLDNLNPRIVIYEVYPVTFALDGVESSLDIISNDHNDRYSLGFLLQTGNIRVLNTLLFSGFHNLFTNETEIAEELVKGVDTYIPGGFVQRKMGYFRHETPGEKREWDLKSKQLQMFQRNVELLRNRHIRLILIQAPIPGALYDSYTNNTIFDNLMHSCAEYYNFNELMQLDDSLHFYDAHHLNQQGVELFNQAVIRGILKKTGQ